MDDRKILIFLAVIGILALIGFIIAIKSDSKNKALSEEIITQQEFNKKQFNDIQSASEVSNANTKIGPQGVQGPIGPAGPPGGTNAGVGPLMCVGEKKIATPTYGKGESAIVYLDNKSYTPVQYWTLKNNPNGTVSIINKLTGLCLQNNNLGDVFSNPCNNSNDQQFTWLSNMQLQSANLQNHCLAIEPYSRNSGNSNNSYNFQTLEQKKKSNNGTVNRLRLSPCSSSQNLNQTWWVGN